jgi:hypothetical protein
MRADDGDWRVSDLYFAAFLRCLGHNVLAIEAAKNGRSYFVFADDESLAADCRKFTCGEPVSIRKFLDSVYALKSLAFKASRAGDLRKVN